MDHNAPSPEKIKFDLAEKPKEFDLRKTIDLNPVRRHSLIEDRKRDFENYGFPELPGRKNTSIHSEPKHKIMTKAERELYLNENPAVKKILDTAHEDASKFVKSLPDSDSFKKIWVDLVKAQGDRPIDEKDYFSNKVSKDQEPLSKAPIQP